MPEHFQLVKFELKNASDNQVLILVSGEKHYYGALRGAFPTHRFSRSFEDAYSGYTWGTYVQNVNDTTKSQIKKVQELFESTVYLNDALTELFALDYHHTPSFHGGGRTETGELVYSAKYGKDKRKAEQLAEAMEQFILTYPVYKRSEVIVAVPPSKPKIFDVPAFLAQSLSARLHIENKSAYIRKNRATAPMKDLETIKDKTDNIKGAFTIVHSTMFKGKQVILIDDIYHSGVTVHKSLRSYKCRVLM